MTRTELRGAIIHALAEYYQDKHSSELPVEYQIGVSVDNRDVKVLESFEELPDGYIYVVLVDLYSGTVSDAVEYVFRQMR